MAGSRRSPARGSSRGSSRSSSRSSFRAPSRATGGRGSAPRSSGIGILFWICLAVIVVAVGIAAREPIAAAWNRLTGQATAPAATAAPVVVRPLAGNEPATNGGAAATSSTTASGTPSATAAPAAATSSAATTSAGSKPPSTTVRTTTPAAPAATTPPPATPSTTAASTRKARLFFAAVDDTGAIALKGVIRSIPASDSPLRDTLAALLKGPNAQELNLGLVSMIPTGASLRGVVMDGSTAVVDFSDGFRFNALGVAAMTAQLRQVVYAATEFPTVKRVQVLIDGKKVTYLGAEGVRIDQPLTRDSFPK